MANPTVFGIDLYHLLFFIGLLILTMASARAVYALIRKALDTKVSKRNSKVAANLVQYAIISVGLAYGILIVLNLDMAALAASLGLVGIAVAFSSQQLIQNFVAGILVTVERNIKLEDWIEITDTPSNRPSRVVDITLTRTMLRDINGRIIIVPNSQLVSSRVVNYSRSGFVMVEIPFPVPLNVNKDVVVEVIKQVLHEHEKVLPNVQGEEWTALQTALKIPQIKGFLNNKVDMDQFRPQVFVQDINMLRTNLNIRIWIREVQLRDRIVSEILNEVLVRLNKSGIRPN